MSLKDEGNSTELDISNILVDLKQSRDMNKVYKTIDLEKREDEEEMRSLHDKLLPISEENLLQIMTENQSFKELSREIKKCDLDNNGYLTSSELNTVF